jgi:hypothetical protein
VVLVLRFKLPMGEKDETRPSGAVREKRYFSYAGLLLRSAFRCLFREMQHYLRQGVLLGRRRVCGAYTRRRQQYISNESACVKVLLIFFVFSLFCSRAAPSHHPPTQVGATGLAEQKESSTIY